MRGEFGEHFISHSGSVKWPPGSYDLTPYTFLYEAMLKVMPIQMSPLQLMHFRIPRRYVPAEIMPKLGYADASFEAQSQSTVSQNHFQILNYMDRT